MEKRDQVMEWAKRQFSERPYRAFSAGECARESGVSVNTAKKYLREMVKQELGIYYFLHEMRNGLAATIYAFTNVRED